MRQAKGWNTFAVEALIHTLHRHKEEYHIVSTFICFAIFIFFFSSNQCYCFFWILLVSREMRAQAAEGFTKLGESNLEKLLDIVMHYKPPEETDE